MLIAALFDLDNTLVNFIDAKLKACEAVVRRIGTGDARELFNYFLRGKGFENCENIADYLVDLGVYSEGLYRECCEIYERVKLDELRVYDGVRGMLSELRDEGFKLGVVMDAENDHPIRRLRKVGLLQFFDVVVSSDEVGRKKPDPAQLVAALKRLRCPPRFSAIVGDSERDIEAGRRLGMVTVLAAYGSWRGVCDADFVAENPLDVARILKKLKYCKPQI